MHPGADGSIAVRAEVPLRDVNREHGLELPEGEGFSTVGGLCLRRAGRVPQAGDQLTLDDGTVLVIEEATERAVVRVRLLPRR